jgi:hypothetical protein
MVVMMMMLAGGEGRCCTHISLQRPLEVYTCYENHDFVLCLLCCYSFLFLLRVQASAVQMSALAVEFGITPERPAKGVDMGPPFACVLLFFFRCLSACGTDYLTLQYCRRMGRWY